MKKYRGCLIERVICKFLFTVSLTYVLMKELYLEKFFLLKGIYTEFFSVEKSYI